MKAARRDFAAAAPEDRALVESVEAGPACSPADLGRLMACLDTNLAGCDLSRTNLAGTVLRNASLLRTDFSFADLSKSALTGCDMELANLGHALLRGAAAGLRPDVLIADSLQASDVPALVERFAPGGRGTIAAIESAALAAGMAHMVDLVVRLARGSDGRQRVVAMQDCAADMVFAYDGGEFRRHAVLPAFTAAVRAAGYGEALTAILR